jgi:hypothetical protein
MKKLLFIAALLFMTGSIFAQVNLDVYPLNVDYNTGSTNTTTKTQVSYVHGDNNAGWFKFDVSAIPAGSIINSITFNAYVYQTNYPYWRLGPLTVDPVTTAAASLFTAIQTGSSGGAYLFRNETSTYAAGWKSHALSAQAVSDLQNLLNTQNWFAMGMWSDDYPSTSYFVRFHGWNEANKPFLTVNYAPPGAVDNPSNLTATAVSQTQINLSWNLNANNNSVMIARNTSSTFGIPVDGTSYTAGNTLPGGGEVVTISSGTSYNDSPLNHSTLYYYKAFSVDASNNYSNGITASDTTFCGIFSVPVAEGFDNTLANTVPLCWSRESNVTAWRTTSAIIPYAGTQCMVTFYNAVSAKNDWFFSPGIDMTQGTSYTIQFYLRAPGYGGVGESLDLKWGTAPNAVSMNATPIWQNTNLLLPNWTLVSATFTPTTSGTHYFGWHANSVADLDYIAVDEVLIMETPSIDLSFADFYQNSALPTPKANFVPFAPAIPNSQIKWSNVSTFVHGTGGVAATNDNHSVLFNNPAKVTITLPASIQVVAEVDNIATTDAAYDLEWEVDGVTQTTYNGPTVLAGTSDVANLSYVPTARGSFAVTGDLVVTGDQILTNNTNSFKMRVYPDVFARTMYDRQVNTVDTYVGYNNVTINVKSGVRYTATGYEKPVGLDAIYRTETATTGTFTVQVCAAGTTTQAPGVVLYTATYTDPVYFTNAGDYLHFAFNEAQVPTFAPGSDYWIIIEYPLGIAYPGAAHSANNPPGITPGRSFVSNSGATTWSPLVLTAVEYAWIMRAVHVEDIPACPQPMALTADNIDDVSADISWTAGGTETDWEYIYGLAPLAYPVISGTATQNTTISLSGLDEETTYQFYVRADCGGEVSDWAGPYSFTTACTGCLQQTYTAGDIPTDFQSPWVGPSTCPGSMTFTVPAGYQVTSVSVSYSMFAQNGAWMSEQVSKLYSPTLLTGESVYYSGVGDAAGTMNYNRANITDFNGATGTFNLELHAGRIWGSVAPNDGCNTYYNRVDNNTWTVKVYYDLIPPSPVFTVNPVSKNYGTVSVGQQSSPQVFNITNSGQGTLEIIGAALTGTDAGDFTIVSQPTYSQFLVSGDPPVQISVAFEPVTAGVKNAYLSISYDDGTLQTFDVPLTGEGFVWPQGSYCADPIPLTLPVVDLTGSTEYYGDFYNDADVNPSSYYLGGNEVVFEFTLPVASYLTGSVAGSWTGLLITEVCPDPVTPAPLLAAGTGSLGGSFTSVLLPAGTYFAIVSTWPTPQFTTYTMNLSAVAAPSCLPPTVLGVSNVQITSADLYWTGPTSAVSWEVEFGDFGFTQGTGDMYYPTTNTQPIINLNANTQYSFYVRAFCGGTDYSDWAGPFSFATPCDVIMAPFLEDFEVTPPACWSIYSTTTQNWGIISSASGYGIGSNSAVANFYSFSDPAPFYLISPLFDASGLTTPTLKFDFAYATYMNEVDELYIQFYGNNGTTFISEVNLSGGPTGDLNTAGATTSSFIPNAGQWNTYQVAIPAGTDMIAFEGVSAYGNNLFIDNVEVFDDVPPTKTLDVEVLLEGLYLSGGVMREAQGLTGAAFPGYADEIFIKLFDPSDLVNPVYENTLPVYLSTSGFASVDDIPSTLDADYYIVIENRNHIETWSATAVPFTGAGPISYSFASAASQAYGNNQKSMGGGYFAILAGDVNQDDIVDASDMSNVENASNALLQGYNPEDANGDGLVDGSDMAIIENNANTLTQVQKP